MSQPLRGTADRSTTLPAVSPVLPTQSQSQHLGRYQLLAKLAAGGMATVYLGRIAGVGGFDRRVAMKVLHPHLAENHDIRDMFLDEARLAARIRHPNVVPVIDVGDEPGHGTFLVMEYIEGVDFSKVLRAAIKRGNRLAPPVVFKVVADMLQGLKAAHELKDRKTGKAMGVVHRDISPHNVLVGVDGISRITDFGIAKAEGRISSTKTGQLKGKLAYMPPERLHRKGDAHIDDARGDLFATAVCLWEALTGKRLFRGEDDLETVRKVLHSDIPKPSSVRPELEPIDDMIMKGLERDPAKRYQTAREFHRALEEASRKIGGMGRAEHVSQLLEALVGQSLERQRVAVEAAVQASEDAVAGAPMAPVTGPFQAVHPDDGPHTGTTTGTALQTQQAPVIWRAAAIVLALAFVGLAAYMFGRERPNANDGTAEVEVAAPPTESAMGLTPPLPAGDPQNTVATTSPMAEIPPSTTMTEEPAVEPTMVEAPVTAMAEEPEPAVEEPVAVAAAMRPRMRPRMRATMTQMTQQTQTTTVSTPMMSSSMMNSMVENAVLDNPYGY